MKPKRKAASILKLARTGTYTAYTHHTRYFWQRFHHIYTVIYGHIQSYTVIYGHIQSYTAIYRHIQSYTVIYGHIQAYTGIYSHIRSYTGIYSHIQSYTVIYSHIRSYTGIYGYIQAYTGIYRHIQAYTGIYRHIQAYTGIYRHIRSHTGMYGIYIRLWPTLINAQKAILCHDNHGRRRESMPSQLIFKEVHVSKFQTLRRVHLMRFNLRNSHTKADIQWGDQVYPLSRSFNACMDEHV